MSEENNFDEIYEKGHKAGFNAALTEYDPEDNCGKPIEKVGQIYELMAKAMADVKPVGKEGKNKDQGWNYRRAEDIYAVCQYALSKHGISIWAKPLKVVRNSVQSGRGTKGFHVIADYRFRFRAPDGSYDDYYATGESIDWSDKVSNKVITFAQKNCLLAAFCIPTELLDDADKESPEIAAQPQSNQQSTRRQPQNNRNNTMDTPQAKGQPKADDPVTTPQLTALHTLATNKGFRAERIKEALKVFFDYESSKQLNQNQYAHFYRLINETEDWNTVQEKMVDHQAAKDQAELEKQVAEQQKKSDGDNPVDKPVFNHAPGASNPPPASEPIAPPSN